MLITISGLLFSANEEVPVTLKVDLNKDNFTIVHTDAVVRIVLNGKTTIVGKESFRIT